MGANLRPTASSQVEKVFDEIMETLVHATTPSPRSAWASRGWTAPTTRASSAASCGASATARPRGWSTTAPSRWWRAPRGGSGIVVLAGTGSICYGADRTGRTARAGGYGFLLADEGSGYWLGHQSLRAAVRAADGRGPETRLQGLIFEALGVASVAELIPRVYEKGLPKHRIAALASLVQAAHDAGDAVAADLIEAAGRELGLAARSVARQLELGDEPYPVVLAGGVFKGCPSVVDSLTAAARAARRRRPALLTVEPARGAVALALDLLKT